MSYDVVHRTITRRAMVRRRRRVNRLYRLARRPSSDFDLRDKLFVCFDLVSVGSSHVLWRSYGSSATKAIVQYHVRRGRRGR